MKPDCWVSVTVTGPVVVPPEKVSGKLTAPVPSAVGADVGASTDTPGDPAAVITHPPAGVAPVIDPAGAVEGTTCLTTVIEPWQLP